MDLCVYHSADMDGWCSGAIVNKHCGYDVKFKGFNYSPNFNVQEFIEKYEDCDTIYIVDYSFKLKDLGELLKSGYDIVWIDHHKSAIEEYAKSGFFKSKKISDNIIQLTIPGTTFVGYISETFSGAKIAYEVLIKDKTDNMSNIVDLVSVFDTWNIDSPLWERAKQFSAGSGLYNLMPWKEEWIDLFDEEVVLEGIIQEGEVIIRYQNQTFEREMYGYGGTLEWEGYTWLCINNVCNSLLADTVFDPKIHDAILYYKYKPSEKLWKLSFFNSSKKQGINGMNKIAEKYGLGRGGGHDAAAGCMVENLPFELKDIIPIEKPF